MKSLNLSSLFAKFLFFAAVLIVACIFMFKGCDEDVNYVHDSTDSLKQVIAEQTKIKDSLLIESKKKDTLRLTIIKRYTTLKHDTIIKQVCDPIIQLCDSIILVDSSLITDLKHVIKVDSVIIDNCRKASVIDSTTIVGLTKEVKKHKRHKRWLVGGLIGISVLSFLK